MSVHNWTVQVRGLIRVDSKVVDWHRNQIHSCCRFSYRLQQSCVGINGRTAFGQTENFGDLF